MMSTFAFSFLFLAMLALATALRLWLSARHMNHVATHRDAVPAEFSARISLADHQRAADYTRAKSRLGFIEIGIETVLLLVMTLGGLLDAIDQGLSESMGRGYLHGLALFAAAGTVSFLVALPTGLYRTFRIESWFGFNKTTPALWLADLAKGIALAIVVGGPLLLAALWLMETMGEWWWLYVWIVWLGFNLLVLFLYPTVIAPLFNKFSPLDDAALKTRIESLLARCGFSSSGLFVMDGSKRSSHGNAYFTGFGRNKRIVFFDTLLQTLAPTEIEAVLAHELGHFKHRHVIKRMAAMAVLALAFLWLLAQLMAQTWFFHGLGIGQPGTAMALLLFSMVLPVFLFPLAPLTSGLSRRYEYEADAYAAHQTNANDLINALVKLYRDNAATLTPDPLHSLFHDSHPPAAARIARLQGSAVRTDAAGSN